MSAALQMPPIDLPPLAGRIDHNAPISAKTWFRVGGPAETLIRPANPEDLAHFLKHLDPTTPITILGAASNVIIRDGGLPGITIRLARGFNEITPDLTGIAAGAACLDATVAEHAAAASLAGLEYLSGIPGTIGGAIAMNAGAYGNDVANTLDWAELITPEGIQRLKASELNFAYRHATLPKSAIVIRARFHAHPGDPTAQMEKIRASREATQPIRARTGGSTFRNPPGHKAWQLIDAIGARGERQGGAQVSEKHTNFLINTGTATAADLESLGESLRHRVQTQTGITLEWEIKRFGLATHPVGWNAPTGIPPTKRTPQ